MSRAEHWPEGHAVPNDPTDDPLEVTPSEVAEAWSIVKSDMEREGWRFRDIATRHPSVAKFGFVACKSPGLLEGLRGFASAISDHFSIATPGGLILIRSAPTSVSSHGMAPSAYIRARFGFVAKDSDMAGWECEHSGAARTDGRWQFCDCGHQRFDLGDGRFSDWTPAGDGVRPV